jgi:hypothetical protein
LSVGARNFLCWAEALGSYLSLRRSGLSFPKGQNPVRWALAPDTNWAARQVRFRGGWGSGGSGGRLTPRSKSSAGPGSCRCTSPTRWPNRFGDSGALVTSADAESLVHSAPRRPHPPLLGAFPDDRPGSRCRLGKAALGHSRRNCECLLTHFLP